MANQNSFDISIAFDAQELKNALDQTRREVQQRYDFKGVMAEVEEDGTTLTIHAESPDKVRALEEIIVGKLVKRNLSPKILGEAKDEDASGGTIRRRFPLVTGIDSDQAKSLSKLIRAQFSKIQAQVQGESLRVTSQSRDELQAVMAWCRENQPLDLPLKFENFR
jgi:cyclic-di-GMP-binding protein